MRFIESKRHRNVDGLILILEKEEAIALARLLGKVEGRTLEAPYTEEWGVVGDPSDAAGYGGKRGKSMAIVVLPDNFRYKKQFLLERLGKKIIRAVFKDA